MTSYKHYTFIVLLSFSALSVYAESGDIDNEVDELLTTLYIERKVAEDHKSCEADKPPLDYKIYNTGRMLADGCVQVHEDNTNQAYKEMSNEASHIEEGDTESYLTLQEKSENVNRSLVISNKFCLKTANQLYWAALRFSYIKAWKLGRMRKRCMDAWDLSIDVNKGSCRSDLTKSLAKFEEIEQYTSEPLSQRNRKKLIATLDGLVDNNNCSSVMTLKQKNRCNSYVQEISDDMVNCSYSVTDETRTTLLDDLKAMPHKMAMAILDSMVNNANADMESTYKAKSDEIVAGLKSSGVHSSEYFQEPHSRGALYYEVATNLKDSANTFDKVALKHSNNAQDSGDVASSLSDDIGDSSSALLDGLASFSDPTSLSSANLRALSALSEKTKRCTYGTKTDGSCNLISTNNFGINTKDISSSLGESESARKEALRLSKLLASVTPFANALARGNPFTADAVSSAEKAETIMAPIVSTGDKMIKGINSFRNELKPKKEPKSFFELAKKEINKLGKKDTRLLASLGASIPSLEKLKEEKAESHDPNNKAGTNGGEVIINHANAKELGFEGAGFAKVDDLEHSSNFDNFAQEEEYEIPIEAQITEDRSISIFKVISNRYFITGFKRLE